MVALHGFSALKILLILYTNFSIATRLPRKYVPATTWIFNIGTLFANELTEGYKLTKMVNYFDPLGGDASSLYSFAAFLDSYGGVMSRWEILFNITVLRQISFNLDYYWSLDRRGGSPIEVCMPNFTVDALLILIRRSNSTPPICPNGTVSPRQHQLKTTISATLLHTPFMRLYTLQVRS